MDQEPGAVSVGDHFALVAADLVGHETDVERGSMLHAPGLRTAGRSFAFATPSELFVKLPATRVSELIGSGVGRPCEIRRGSPMREWVRLVPADANVCASYVDEAHTFVASRKGK
jgi:hypothetical protein